MTPDPTRGTSVRIRGLRPQDVPQLRCALAAELDTRYPGGDAWLDDRVRRSLDGSAISFVAVTEDQVIGFALAQLKRRGVKLSCFWTDLAHRRGGIGRALLTRAVDAFGARSLYLTVDSGDAAAMAALLEPAGFAEAARLPGRYRPGHTEIVYRRPADTAPSVRALSLTRPWGTLILSGGKNIENRSRRTNYRGILVLHGAQSRTTLADTFCDAHNLPAPPPADACPTGYLGIAHLVAVDCHEDDCGGTCSPWAMPGNWHWHVAFPAAFDSPIPGRGNVGLWKPGTDVLAAVADALRPKA